MWRILDDPMVGASNTYSTFVHDKSSLIDKMHSTSQQNLNHDHHQNNLKEWHKDGPFSEERIYRKNEFFVHTRNILS
jgi:hypothetical protein